MSNDQRKDGDTAHRRPEDEPFDFDLPTGSPPPKGDFDAFEIDDMPQPTSTAATTPLKARPAPPPVEEEDDEFSDFSDDEQGEEAQPALRKASRAPVDDDDEDDGFNFGDDEDEDEKPQASKPASSKKPASRQLPRAEPVMATSEDDDASDEDEETDRDGDEGEAEDEARDEGRDDGERKGLRPAQIAVYAASGLFGLGVLYAVWSTVIQPLFFAGTPAPSVVSQLPGTTDLTQKGSSGAPSTLPKAVANPNAPQPSLPAPNPTTPPPKPVAPAVQPVMPTQPLPANPVSATPAPATTPATQQPAVLPQAFIDRVSSLETRLSDMEKRIGGIAQAPARPDPEPRLKSLEERLAVLEQVRPTSPRPAVEPPVKPRIIQQYQLRGVARNVAWVARAGSSGKDAMIEVKEGTALEGAGTVRAITRYEKDWVVVTTDGVIIR